MTESRVRLVPWLRDARGIRRHFVLAVVVVAIVMVVVSSIAHIKARTGMVPLPMSFADSNSNAANADIGAFRDRNKKKGKHTSLHDVLPDETLACPMLGGMRPWYSCSLYRIDQFCSRDGA